MAGSDRLLVVNIGNPSRLLSMTPEGDDIHALILDCDGAPDSIAVDSRNKYIVWANMGTSLDGEDFWLNDGSVLRSNLDGSKRVKIAPQGSTFTPRQIQCDSENGLIYWCDREGMRVMRAKTDGSDVTVLVQTGSSYEHRLV